MSLSHLLGRPFEFTFTPDGQTLLFLRSGRRDRQAKLYALNIATGDERLLVSVDALVNGPLTETTAERADRERKRLKLAGISGYQLSDDGSLLLTAAGRVFVHELSKAETFEVQLPKGDAARPTLSPDGKKVAFVLDYDVHVARLGAKTKRGIKTRTVRLTRKGSAMTPFGMAEFVAQEEMGRHEGHWWSPDSKRLLYQATDQRGLERFTIANAATPERDAWVVPYPRAGGPNADVRLYAVGIGGRGRVEVRWNRSRWPYLAKVIWPRNGPPTALLQARDQQTQVYVRIDPKTGATTKLHDEDDPTWLNIHDSTPWWLDDGSYLWASECDRAWALYRHRPRARRAGLKARTVVVPPEAGFVDLVHVDPRRGFVWFTGGPDPTEQHLWRTRLDGTEPPTRISRDLGHHEASFDSTGDRFVLTRASLDALPESVVYPVDDATAIRDGTPGVPVAPAGSGPKRLPNAERVPADRAHGFHAAIIRPYRFDSTKRYPVILYVYGGPGVQTIKSVAHAYGMHQWLADHGFVVVTIDGRGTPRRGRAHERALRLRFGDVPLDDQVAGLQALGRHYPELDLDRVGIYGWSFGGYLAALAAMRRPDVFKVAVAGAPVVDWTYYDTHYTERYLGLPQHEPEAYRQANLLTYVRQLKIPLMLVHGVADDNVHFGHTLRLADALFRAGRQFELIPLVGLTHQVSDPESPRGALRPNGQLHGRHTLVSGPDDLLPPLGIRRCRADPRQGGTDQRNVAGDHQPDAARYHAAASQPDLRSGRSRRHPRRHRALAPTRACAPPSSCRPSTDGYGSLMTTARPGGC